MAKIVFSKKITVISLLLAALMLRASYWQWERYKSKLVYIKTLEDRFNLPPIDIKEVIASTDSSLLINRKTFFSGTFDFANEIILRNRRLDGEPGVFVLTPLLIDGSDKYILVSRGFIPISHSTPEMRNIFFKNNKIKSVGLIKESMYRKLFAPKDPPTGEGEPRVDAWLRVDLPAIAKQLPYKILPVYIELMGDGQMRATDLIQTSSARDEIFFLPSRTKDIVHSDQKDLTKYPIPVFSTVISPSNHLGYVFEWAIMAVITICIGIVAQLRRELKVLT